MSTDTHYHNRFINHDGTFCKGYIIMYNDRGKTMKRNYAYEFTRNDGTTYKGNTILFDFRKDGVAFFSEDEIKADPVLKRIAKRLKVQEGALEVRAADAKSAFRKFFGVTPENACDLKEEVCPGFIETRNGWSTPWLSYEIVPETSW
jgi:hypothetical protein